MAPGAQASKLAVTARGSGVGWVRAKGIPGRGERPPRFRITAMKTPGLPQVLSLVVCALAILLSYRLGVERGRY